VRHHNKDTMWDPWGQVLQQRLQYHFQLAEFAEGPDLQFVYPTALTAQEHALVHEMVRCTPSSPNLLPFSLQCDELPKVPEMELSEFPREKQIASKTLAGSPDVRGDSSFTESLAHLHC